MFRPACGTREKKHRRRLIFANAEQARLSEEGWREARKIMFGKSWSLQT
jgi:hypothetical protein